MSGEPEPGNAPVTSEDDIRRYTIGPVVFRETRIVLVRYDPRWPAMFEREADRIRAALAGLTIRVEHVGSTSVPGLAAKPIIDIVLAVPDSADEVAYVPALERAGYILHNREPGWLEHRMFKGPEIDLNLHVFSAGEPEIDRMIGFRDRLRSHDDECAAYLLVKQELAQRTWRHVQFYADAKTTIVEQILARATAARDSWQTLPS